MKLDPTALLSKVSAKRPNLQIIAEGGTLGIVEKEGRHRRVVLNHGVTCREHDDKLWVPAINQLEVPWNDDLDDAAETIARYMSDLEAAIKHHCDFPDAAYAEGIWYDVALTPSGGSVLFRYAAVAYQPHPNPHPGVLA